jgi:Uma2 family endonuclease
MSPIGSLHAKVVNRLNKELSQRLFQAGHSELILSIQNPVQLRKDSEPEPDLALLASEGAPGQHPTPDDVLLIIEVADTSLEHDRDIKLPLYAAAGIPEYWLVNLSDRSIDVYREPDGKSYARRIRHRADDSLRLAALPGLEAIQTSDLFPDETRAASSSTHD